MTGKLTIIPTPIGNLEDITLRAINVLKEVDVLLCEDTRHSVKLLNYLQINKLTKALRFSYFSTPIDFVEDQLLQIILINWLAKTNITVCETLEEIKEIF